MGRKLIHPLPATGTTFGRWTVAGAAFVKKRSLRVPCRCACGRQVDVVWRSLFLGVSISCGCYRLEKQTTHGGWHERLYGSWHNMIQRCYYRKSPRWKHYGGRGIIVCADWRNDYAKFRDWANQAGYHDGLTLERKDVNGDYSPENCEWIPLSQQSRNTKDTLYITVNGRRIRFIDFSDDPRRVISYSALRQRIFHLGWDPERALTTPAR